MEGQVRTAAYCTKPLILPARPPGYVARFGALAAIGAPLALVCFSTALFAWPVRRSCCGATCS